MNTIKLPKPLDYQRDILEWVDDPSIKYITFVGGRQSGKSFLNKLLLIKWAMSDANCKIGYIVPTLKLARKFMKDLAKACRKIIVSYNLTDLVMEFKTGSSLQFFSTEQGDAIRGFNFHYLILDEAAYMSDEVFNLIIKPTQLVLGKKMIMCSTPNSATGFFYNHYTYGLNEDMPEFRTKQTNIYENPFVTSTDIQLLKSQVSDRVFQQEYLAKFVQGYGSVFTNFKTCINNNPKKTDVRFYAAIDWAKTHDYTVLTIINDLKQVVEIFRINKLDYTDQIKKIVFKLNYYKPKLVISEENNVGAVVNELLRDNYSGQVKRVTLDNVEKRDIIENLVLGFEQNDITILENDELLLELQSFTCVFNPQTKSVKYQAPVGLHDDCVISLAYAYSLVKTRKGRYSLA